MAATSSQAAVTFEFNTPISGSPAGGPTFAKLTMVNGGANTVNFTFENTSDSGTAPDQFISKLLLNVSPYVVGTMTWSAPQIQAYGFDLDGQNDSGGKFDYQVDFVTANNGNRFKSGQTVTWSVTGTGLTENSFNVMSAGNNSYLAMIHIQNIPPSGDSAKVIPGEPVPEPASLAALGLGALALLRRRRATA